MEKRYPLTWKYLMAHEKELKSHEGFKERRDWYAYSAARSLDDYEEAKFLIQGFSKSSAASMDIESKPFFGPDIYGLRIGQLEGAEAKVILAILNSKVANFYI